MGFHAFFIVVLLAYLLVTALYLLRLVWNRPILSAIALRLCLATAVIHAVGLFWHFWRSPVPLFSTYLDAFQLCALILALVFVVLCFWRGYFAAGPLFSTGIVVFSILSLTYENPYSWASGTPGYAFLFFHLSTIFLSFTFFLVAFVSAVLFLVSEYQIKHKIISGPLAKLPSLHDIDDLHYKAMTVGFVLFTLSILMGAGYAKLNTGHYITTDSKQILSFVIWIFLSILLNLRVRRGWLGHKGVVLSLIGFAGLVLLSLVGFR